MMARPPRVSRARILEAAARAFAERGFGGTTLADVAESIGLTPSALLRHFRTKEELFAAATSGRDIPLPPGIAELAGVDPATDPRIVLRRVAEQVVPFIQSVIGTAIARQMHERAQQTTVVVPFDTAGDEAPPRRAMRILTEYFARAMNATVIRPGDPRALALLFMGQMQSYVFIHHVLNVTPVYPLPDYLDALLDLWSRGAIEAGGTRARKKKRASEDRTGDRDPRRRGRGAAVLPRATKAEAARPRRNAGGKDSQRGVAGRRTRNARPRR
jgi:AcrR family transcriptional regulator